jgi:hypothetical protein
MKTILLTFADDTQRSQFLEIIRTIAVGMTISEQTETQSNGQFLINSLDDLRLDPPIKTDTERQVALFVAGTKMDEGNLVAMNQRFNREIHQHSGSVQIREMRDGQWTIIRQRPMR